MDTFSQIAQAVAVMYSMTSNHNTRALAALMLCFTLWQIARKVKENTTCLQHCCGCVGEDIWNEWLRILEFRCCGHLCSSHNGSWQGQSLQQHKYDIDQYLAHVWCRCCRILAPNRMQMIAGLQIMAWKLAARRPYKDECIVKDSAL